MLPCCCCCYCSSLLSSSQPAHTLVAPSSARHTAQVGPRPAASSSKQLPGVRGPKTKVGRRTIAYPGDGVYEGEYVDGLKQGEGRFFYVLGNVYEGQWLLDQKH